MNNLLVSIELLHSIQPMNMYIQLIVILTEAQPTHNDLTIYDVTIHVTQNNAMLTLKSVYVSEVLCSELQ